MTAVRVTWILSLAFASATGFASASINLTVEASICNTQTVFAGGFERQAQPQSSGGSGGGNDATFRLTSGGVGYYAYVPATRRNPAPALVVMHGAAGAGSAPQAAEQTRDAWSTLADTAGVIIIAPIASGAQGGWAPNVDFPAIDTVLNDAQAAYSIDLTRRYLWGFSAGGHVAHALALLRDNDRYAAYAVSAGVLQAYAGTTAPAQAVRQPPLAIWIGSQDSLLPFAQADRTRFNTAGWIEGNTLDFQEFPDGHTYYTSQFPLIWKFMCPWAVEP